MGCLFVDAIGKIAEKWRKEREAEGVQSHAKLCRAQRDQGEILKKTVNAYASGLFVISSTQKHKTCTKSFSSHDTPFIAGSQGSAADALDNNMLRSGEMIEAKRENDRQFSKHKSDEEGKPDKQG